MNMENNYYTIYLKGHQIDKQNVPLEERRSYSKEELMFFKLGIHHSKIKELFTENQFQEWKNKTFQQ
jgi:hypothetical protein